MSEATANLVDAIHSGNAVEIEAAFGNAMAEKIAPKIDAMRQEVAANMFKTEAAAEEPAVDETAAEVEETNE